MTLEIWKPDGRQLKERAEEWMARRMGADWRRVYAPGEGEEAVTVLLKRSGDRWLFFMTASVGEEEKEETSLTRQLYRDSWGTALLDSGRELLQKEITRRSSITNRRYTLQGPGLNGVKLETMKELYEELEGWRIGLSLNGYCVLRPEKSCGGWYVPQERAEESDRGGGACHSEGDRGGRLGEGEGNCDDGAGYGKEDRGDRACHSESDRGGGACHSEGDRGDRLCDSDGGCEFCGRYGKECAGRK